MQLCNDLCGQNKCKSTKYSQLLQAINLAVFKNLGITLLIFIAVLHANLISVVKNMRVQNDYYLNLCFNLFFKLDISVVVVELMFIRTMRICNISVWQLSIHVLLRNQRKIISLR